MSGPDRWRGTFDAFVAGQYTIDRELTPDGGVRVFLARDLRLERPVALYLLAPSPETSALDRRTFVARARAAARLGHPSIAPIHAVEEADDLAWYVSGFVPGRSLAARLRSGFLSPAATAELARTLAWALAYAHENGISHGALGPDHIFLEDGSDRVVIAGFGTARPGPPPTVRDDLQALIATVRAALGAPAAVTDAEWLERLPPWASRPLSECLAFIRSAPSDATTRIAAGFAPPVRAAAPAVIREWLHVPNPLKVYLVSWSLAVSVLWLVDTGGTIDTYIYNAWTPWLVLWPLAIWQLRPVVRAGYQHADIVRALEQRLEVRREELRTRSKGRSTSAFTWALLLILLGVAGSMLDPFTVRHTVMQQFAILVIGLLFIAAVVQAWRGRRSDRPPRDEMMEQRTAFWRGALGRFTFRLAGRGASAAPTSGGLDPRPTTVVLAESVRALALALPASLLRQFPAVPETARRLEGAAAALRSRVARLEALPPDSRSKESDAALAAADARHAEAVIAMETLRLALLSAAGGLASIGDPTRELESAVAAADQVDRLMAAREELSEIGVP